MHDLEERLRQRGDLEDHVALRLSSTPQELEKGYELATYVVVNDDIERASGEILSILEELRRLRRAPS
jgi:guanylate kinase